MHSLLNPASGRARRSFVCALAALLLASCATPPSPRDQAAGLNRKGETLLASAGHDAAAEAAFKEAIQADPQFAPPHSGLAQAWQRLKSHSRDEIVAEYETAIRLDPHFPYAHENLGLLLLAEPEQRDAAIDHLRAAVSENLESAGAWTHLGDALRDTTDWEGMVSAYRRAASLPGADRLAWFRLGSALRERPGHENEAIEAFTAALKVDPNQAIAHTSLGLLLKQKAGRGDEAIQHLREAARLEPAMSINWSNLARAQYELNYQADATASINRALALDARNFAAYQVRADLHLLNNEWEAALADYEKVLEINPRYPEVLLQVGAMRYQRKADYDGAIAALDQVIAQAPNYAIAYGYRSASLLEKKNLEAAAADIERAIKLEPNTAWYWGLRGEIKLRQEDPASALPDFEHVLSLTPQDERTLIQRGLAHFELSELEPAMRDVEQAVAINARSPYSHSLRGRLRQLAGDQAGAIADFTSAIALGLTGSPSYFERGMSRELLDDFPRALKEYEHAMEVNTETRTYIGYWAFFVRIRLNLPPDENDLKARGLGADQSEWMNGITGYLGGKITEEALLAQAKAHPNKVKADEQYCEGLYYVGMHHLLVDRDAAAARPWFEKCIATNVRKFAEVAFSRRELARMDKAAKGGKQKTEDRGQPAGDGKQKTASAPASDLPH